MSTGPGSRALLEEFVNREQELRRFSQLLEDLEKHIMSVWGDSGIGKSSLLARMIHECAQRRLRKAEVVWTETRPHDYMAIMRKIRDDLGVEAFQRFTDLINFLTVPRYDLKISVEGMRGISVAQGAKIEGSQTGDIAGIVVKDSMFIAPRSDMAVPEAERMARLTDRFVEDLQAYAANQQLVVFFDAIEKMSPDTEKWVWGELLTAVCEGRISNVKFILCGQKRPTLTREWRNFVEEAELHPLGLEPITLYLEKRGVEKASREAVAEMLLVATKGKISQIAEYVDAFLGLQERRLRSDE